ncbi:MAG: hypothetical protein ACK4MF_05370 [Hyphomicrobiaceae bacterium]
MNSDPLWIARIGGREAPLEIDAHPVYDRLLGLMPPHIRASFSPVQLAALSHATKPRPEKRLVDFRVSLPFFGRRYYLTILLGKERRSRQRLHAERQLSTRKATITYFVAALLIAATVLLCAMAFAYVLKSIVGLDLVKAPSIW